MRPGFRITLWLALLALVTPALLPASTKAAKKPVKKAAAAPAEAPRPPLPEELPPVAPRVTYREGQLTIIAQNSTLQDILSAVRKATGAAIDAPAAAAGDRVATRLGPGAPRDVLAALLNGSRFDYILLGSPASPGNVHRLILSPRSGGAASTDAPASSPSALNPAPAPGSVAPRTLRPDISPEESAAPDETVEPAEEVVPEPESQPPPQQEIKTPEQLQEELRQHEEQQQQQPQQPPPQQQPPEQPPPGPPPQ